MGARGLQREAVTNVTFRLFRVRAETQNPGDARRMKVLNRTMGSLLPHKPKMQTLNSLKYRNN